MQYARAHIHQQQFSIENMIEMSVFTFSFCFLLNFYSRVWENIKTVSIDLATATSALFIFGLFVWC